MYTVCQTHSRWGTEDEQDVTADFTKDTRVFSLLGCSHPGCSFCNISSPKMYMGSIYFYTNKDEFSLENFAIPLRIIKDMLGIIKPTLKIIAQNVVNQNV